MHLLKSGACTRCCWHAHGLVGGPGPLRSTSRLTSLFLFRLDRKRIGTQVSSSDDPTGKGRPYIDIEAHATPSEAPSRKNITQNQDVSSPSPSRTLEQPHGDDSSQVSSHAEADMPGPPAMSSAETFAESPTDDSLVLKHAVESVVEEELQEERARVEKIKQRLMRRLRGMTEEAGEEPGAAAASSGRSQGESLRSSGTSLVIHTPWMTYLLAITVVVVFALQWWPLLPTLQGALRHFEVDKLLAFALVVPDTPAAGNWQLDVVSVAAGQWGSIWSSCFVHSGLLPFALSLPVLMEAGNAIEVSFGPLVLLIHIAMCGLGAAATQLLFQPQSHSISGTGVVAGLVMSMFVHQVRSGYPIRPTPRAALLLVAAPPLALYQPMLGMGGLIGACLGGALAGLSCFSLVAALRYCLFLPFFLLTCAVELFVYVFGSVPRLLRSALRLLLSILRVVGDLLLSVVSTLREMK